MGEMLLAIDIGNTSITFGQFSGKKLVRHWKVSSNCISASSLKKTLLKCERIEGACVSSVVPKANATLKKVIKKLFGCPICFVDARNAGIKIVNYNPKEIGADRLVNAVAAYKKYRKALIIVDFGTATTFDYVTARGEYAGGAIAPGIEISSKMLTEMTAKLPRAPIKKTNRVVGRKTIESMQAGVFHGYVGLVDHIVIKMKKEVRTNPIIIATGGLAPVIIPSTQSIKLIEPFLTLEGLQIIWDRATNRRQSHSHS